MNGESFNRFLAFLKTVRLGWLIPFFLLVKGEDPRTQLRAIFAGVVVPILAILVFLTAWEISSKQIVTKFGTVPGPRQVWSAWESLMNEIRMEKIKEADHQRRAREKRMKNIEKYAGVFNELPGDKPDFGDTERNQKALSDLSKTFDEINEMLEVSNAISGVSSEQEAQVVVDQFQFESSKEIAAVLISQLLPKEISYRMREEELNMGERFNPIEGDTEELIASKESLKAKELKLIAAEKADLLIERQRLTSFATREAIDVLNSIPSFTKSILGKLDSTASKVGPRLDGWYASIEASEIATGQKYPNRVRVKMLKKSFEYKPYPGKDTYLNQIATSLKTVFFGFMIASLVAIPIGIVCGLNKTVNNAINPLIQIFKPVSPLAWLPIVMIVVGALYVSDDPMFEISFINSAITVALCSLWPTLVNTAVGVASTDKDFINVARVLKLSWVTKITKVALPASLPLVFTGLRLSLGVGWMVLIAAEMLAQNPGLGKFVWDMFQNGSSETLSMIMVAVFTIGVIGFALDTVMLSLQQLVSFGEAI